MSPSNPSVYVRYSHLAYTKLLSYSVLWNPLFNHGSNADYVIIGEFGYPNIFSLIRSMFGSISHIRLWTVPSKVGDVIVEAVSIIMTCFKSIRTWAYKCFKYQPVYELGNESLIANGNPNELISFFRRQEKWLHYSPLLAECRVNVSSNSTTTPHRSIVIDCISKRSRAMTCSFGKFWKSVGVVHVWRIA